MAVWGPPGTGKTYTMSQIAKTYVKQGKTVLIVSHSNVSVDGVVKKIVELLDVDMELEKFFVMDMCVTKSFQNIHMLLLLILH